MGDFSLLFFPRICYNAQKRCIKHTISMPFFLLSFGFFHFCSPLSSVYFLLLVFSAFHRKCFVFPLLHIGIHSYWLLKRNTKKNEFSFKFALLVSVKRTRLLWNRFFQHCILLNVKGILGKSFGKATSFILV